MSSVITGKVTRRENGYIYIDTNGDGIPDKNIFCAKNAFTYSATLGGKRFSYYDAYAVIRVGDTVSFPVKLEQKKLDKVFFINSCDLVGDPIVNENNAFTLRVFRIWKECSALIEKDKNFAYLKIK